MVLVDVALDGSGHVERIFTSEYQSELAPGSFSTDDGVLAFVETRPQSREDIWLLPMQGEGVPQALLMTRWSERSPEFSPDGRWLAYESDETGRYEVYVIPYPGPGRKSRISTGGGREPVWAPGGDELFYRNLEGDRMMVVRFTRDFTPETPNGVVRRTVPCRWWRSAIRQELWAPS